jgi:DNA polymerase III epsilon subunit-like protein
VTDKLYVFFDTEFTSINPINDQALISIGLVTDEGREFYAELSDTWQESMCSAFVQDNVLPLLEGGDALLLEAQLALQLKEWIEGSGAGEVVLVSDAPQFDWPWVCELFEYHGQWPKNLRRECRRVQFRDERHMHRFNSGLASFWQTHREKQHHALWDAKALKFAWQYSVRKPT